MAAVSPTPSTPSLKEDHGVGAIFDIDLEKQRSLYSKRKSKGSQKHSDGDGDSVSQASESATLMSKHSMNLGCYSINLGTEAGQKLHRYHLIILPLIPILILLIQNLSTYNSNADVIQDLDEVSLQVRNSLDFAELTKKLQQERVSVAMKFFVQDRDDIERITDFDSYVAKNVDSRFLKSFTTAHTFNETDQVLQNVAYWPNIATVAYFKTKLKFQIQHSLFRTKIQDGDKNIDDVLNWYEEVNTQTLKYVTYSIHDSDISDFYKYIIGYKNLLRAVEFSGRAGILGLEYISQSGLSESKFERFIKAEALRREYLNQTFNFLPYLKNNYTKIEDDVSFDIIQANIREQNNASDEVEFLITYAVDFLEYQDNVRQLSEEIAESIGVLVNASKRKLQRANIIPLIFLVILASFIPVCVLMTMNITTSMTRFSQMYNSKVDVYKAEKRKTEKLLSSLLPTSVIRKLKKGQMPKPQVFESVSIFFCDIVSFTTICSDSTAHQIIEFLNDLYHMFDERIDNFDVYKVETIGDAYMVASGIPVPNGLHHAIELSKMALDLLAKVLTFEIKHKPNHRLKLRMGMHSGPVVGGVVGSKIPHYSVFGDTVELASLMESSGMPMKIQITSNTKDILHEDGSFNVAPRGNIHLPTIGNIHTYWLIGRKE